MGAPTNIHLDCMLTPCLVFLQKFKGPQVVHEAVQAFLREQQLSEGTDPARRVFVQAGRQDLEAASCTLEAKR